MLERRKKKKNTKIVIENVRIQTIQFFTVVEDMSFL